MSNHDNNSSMLAPQQGADFKHLVLAGGGAKGALYPGALQALDDEGILSNIQTVAGSSAGALTASMLAIGLTPKEIAEQFKSKGFADFLKTTKLTEGGLFSTGSLKRHVNEVLFSCLKQKLTHLYAQHKDKITNRDDRRFVSQLIDSLTSADRRFCRRPTFNDLGRIADIFQDLDPENPNPFKKLTVTMTEYDPERPNDPGRTVHCKADHPEFGTLSIAEAVAGSACLPIVFAPMQIGNKIYRDGGIGQNTPIDAVPENERQQTLALVFEEESREHEDIIFSSAEPQLAEAGFADKVIQTRFGASLPQSVYNDAVDVRKHAKETDNVIRLMVPSALSITTPSLSPELAAQATVNGYVSVKAWLKAFRPRPVTIVPSLVLPDQEQDLVNTLDTQIQGLHILSAEKEALLKNIEALKKEKNNYDSFLHLLDKKDRAYVENKITHLNNELERKSHALTTKNDAIIKTKEAIAAISDKLLESKTYARHFLTYQILAWKRSIASLKNPLFKSTLLNFIEDIYQASKNVDDGKFFADHIAKINDIITCVNSDPLTIQHKLKLIPLVETLIREFHSKGIFMETFAYHASILLKSVTHTLLFSDLETQAAQLPETLKEPANETLAQIKEAMHDVYDNHYDNCTLKLSKVLYQTQDLFDAILEPKGAKDDAAIATTTATLSKPTLKRTSSRPDLKLSMETAGTSAMTAPLASQLDSNIHKIADIKTKASLLRATIYELTRATAANKEEKPETDSPLLRTFNKFSQIIGRFFQATATVMARPAEMFGGLWRHTSRAENADIAIVGEITAPAA